MFADNPTVPTKERSDDRILVLRPKEGMTAQNSLGLTDTRLFKGGNNLHVIRNPETMFWSFKYDVGAVPPTLADQSFTTFQHAFNHARRYFAGRNVEVTEVKD